MLKLFFYWSNTNNDDLYESVIIRRLIMMYTIIQVLIMRSDDIIENRSHKPFLVIISLTFLPLGAPRVSLPFLINLWVRACTVRLADVWALNWTTELINPKTVLGLMAPPNKSSMSLVSSIKENNYYYYYHTHTHPPPKHTHIHNTSYTHTHTQKHTCYIHVTCSIYVSP